MFKPVKNGQQMGVNDGGPPEEYSAKDLSEVHDALAGITAVFGEDTANRIWFDHIPHRFRMDYNWTNWKYHARKRK